MKLRNATKSDAQQVGIVLKECYNIESLEEGKEVFLSELKKGINYIVAEEKAKIVGITTWYMHGLHKHGLAELDRIAVMPDARGKGVAKMLFDELKKQAKKTYAEKRHKLRKIYLLTHESNKRAQAFYENIRIRH